MKQPKKLMTFYENIAFDRINDNAIVLNFGPQHPSAHGMLRLILELAGEQVLQSTPALGFLHRGLDKMADTILYMDLFRI